jgi:hypothetical protein
MPLRVAASTVHTPQTPFLSREAPSDVSKTLFLINTLYHMELDVATATLNAALPALGGHGRITSYLSWQRDSCLAELGCFSPPVQPKKQKGSRQDSQAKCESAPSGRAGHPRP